MNGFVQSYYDQEKNVAHSRKIMYYFPKEKLPVLTTLASRLRGVQWMVFIDSRADAVQSGVCSLRDFVRPGEHGCFLLQQAISKHL